jgi:AI-2E family transporter
MRDVLKSIHPWVVFSGSVLIVAVLYWAQAILVPVALAVLLTFLLTPVVTPLQRWLGRVPAVLTITIAASVLLGLAGWGLTRQVASVLDELPAYRENVRQRVRDIRVASRGGSVERLQETVADIKEEIDKETPPPGTTRAPVVVRPETAPGSWIPSTDTLGAGCCVTVDRQGPRLWLYRLPRDASEAIAATIVSGSTGFGR